MSKFRFCLLVSTLLLFSTYIFAVDGVVLINQASVMAAGGFPYQINASGSYRLSSNLVPPGFADAIHINADNVTLDLNGFSISGSGTCTGQTPNITCSDLFANGVFATTNNITVRNGSITGMGTAVYMGEGQGNLAEELHVSQVSQGIIIQSGIARRNTVTLAASIGITARGSTVIENVLVNNGFGFSGLHGFGLDCIFSPCVVGSNIFSGNFTNVSSQSTSIVSQNNNSCDGTAC